MKAQNSIRNSYSKITVDSVGPSLNVKKHQAQIRQTVTALYPGARANNSLSDKLFEPENFGLGESYDEVRVTWIPVPIGTTIEEVQAKLAKHPNARLVRTLSLNPILSEEQIQAMEQGVSDKTMEDYKAKFIVDPSGAAVLYKGHKQYRHIAFRTEAVADVDLRESDLKDAGPISMGTAEPVKKEAF